jgi:hypothetical protein
LGRTNNLALIGALVVGWGISKVSLKTILLDLSLLILVIALVLLPAILHSSEAAGKFVLITYTGVYNFTMGNLPGVSGAYTDQATHSLGPTLQFITEQPLAWLALLIRKCQLFFTFPWSPVPFFDLSLYYISLWSGFIILYLFYFFKSFTPRRSALHLALIFYTASIIIAHVEDEYRLPILPVLFIFVALLLVELLFLFSLGLTRVTAIITRLQLQKPALALASSLSIIVLFILLLPSFETSQRGGSMQEQPAYGGVIVGQNFQMECPYLNQIAVKLAAAGSGGSTIFHLQENNLEGPEIYRQVLNTTQLISAHYHYITFPEVSDSAGKQYTFYFDTAELKTAEEGLFFFGGQPPFAESLNRLDPKRFQNGAFIKLDHSTPNIEKLNGNLVFTASCRATPATLASISIERVARVTPFPKTATNILLILLILSGATFLGSCLFIVYKIFIYRRATYPEKVE